MCYNATVKHGTGLCPKLKHTPTNTSNASAYTNDSKCFFGSNMLNLFLDEKLPSQCGFIVQFRL